MLKQSGDTMRDDILSALYLAACVAAEVDKRGQSAQLAAISSRSQKAKCEAAIREFNKVVTGLQNAGLILGATLSDAMKLVVADIQAFIALLTNLRTAHVDVIHPDFRTRGEAATADDTLAHPPITAFGADHWFVVTSDQILRGVLTVKFELISAASRHRIISLAFKHALQKPAFSEERIKMILRRNSEAQ